jgi:hypothetical protein
LIEKCNQNTGQCESEEKYNEFMKDFFIQPFVYRYSMSFSKFGSTPLFKDYIFLDWIYPVTAYNGYNTIDLLIRKNVFETNDDFIQYG